MEEQDLAISIPGAALEKLVAHKLSCRGTFKGSMFLDGDHYYSNTYVCSVCSDRVNEQGSTRKNGKRTRSYYDNKEGRWYE